MHSLHTLVAKGIVMLNWKYKELPRREQWTGTLSDMEIHKRLGIIEVYQAMWSMKPGIYNIPKKKNIEQCYRRLLKQL